MKNLKAILFSSIAVLTLTMSSCVRVAPNHQGVLMTSFGQNGKSDFELKKGRVNVMSPGTELFQVPLFLQRAEFAHHLELKAADNTEFKTKPIYSYEVIADRAVDIVFQNKQIGSGSGFMTSLEENILNTRIHDILNKTSRKFTTDSLMANQGSLRFEETVEASVRKEFETMGINLKTFSCRLEFSQKVTDKIDNRNEVNTNITVLDQQIEEQRKRNELAILKRNEALIKSEGLTEAILKDKAIEKWNGILPSTFSGSNLPFVKNIK